ncbi:DUF1275 domain-containing protein [Salinibacterium sp. dk2585]|uniref:YoaK family protein n=1 Tax=unclassified Salinibacterium TaxID=2632331 RepID=UPI0011C25047|nr:MULTISPECIES: YoaK family protein [unclassified Salinibacterium]QEE62325.1 DUF1275 domain-containing protein [Salinibacterium sp. dk2585]TXK53676.1 DUF1275 domain-containing protein [Salinibacterium sp. dk5596]
MTASVRHDPERLHLALMLTLTFSTGVIDSVCYLGLDRVFTGNMTGNILILGMGLLGAGGLPIVGPVIALFAFALGAVIAGRAFRSLPPGWTWQTTAMLTVVAALLVGIASVTVAFPSLPRGLALSATGTLGVAMGIQAATARHIAVKEVTTVVVTATLTGLASESWLGARTGQLWGRRAGAILLLLAGAVLGALTLKTGTIGLGLVLAAVITSAVAAVGHAQSPTSAGRRSGEAPP